MHVTDVPKTTWVNTKDIPVSARLYSGKETALVVGKPTTLTLILETGAKISSSIGFPVLDFDVPEPPFEQQDLSTLLARYHTILLREWETLDVGSMSQNGVATYKEREWATAFDNWIRGVRKQWIVLDPCTGMHRIAHRKTERNDFHTSYWAAHPVKTLDGDPDYSQEAYDAYRKAMQSCLNISR
jgi:hypothetical protein